MPRLLVGSGPEGAGGKSVETHADGSVDFWQLFSHVTAGDESSYNVRSTQAAPMRTPAGRSACNGSGLQLWLPGLLLSLAACAP